MNFRAKHGTLMVALMLSLLSVLARTGSPAIAQNLGGTGLPVVSSTFDGDDEGWTVVGDAQGGAPKPDYFAADGNPGGFVSATDDVIGGAWYWRAPSTFHGDFSTVYTGVLSFDLRQSDATEPTDYPDIIISSNALTLIYDKVDAPGTNWTSYAVLLHETAGWKNVVTGKRATHSEMRFVLSALTDLQIRGEYRGGSDTGGLDNVALIPAVLHKTHLPLALRIPAEAKQ